MNLPNTRLLQQGIILPRAAGSVALAIMIKAPKPGCSKTRLCPPLQPQESAELSRCFLQDTAENISKVASESANAIGAAVYTPTGSEHEFERSLPEDFLLMPQRRGSFGDRLYNGAKDLFSVGFASVCLIGSDSPTLPPGYLKQMLDSLEQTQDGVVLGQLTEDTRFVREFKASSGLPLADESVDAIRRSHNIGLR
jgi:uncharacterized protein